MVKYTKEEVERIVNEAKEHYAKLAERAQRNSGSNQITLPREDFVIILDNFKEVLYEYSGAPEVDYLLNPIYKKYALLGIY